MCVTCDNKSTLPYFRACIIILFNIIKYQNTFDENKSNIEVEYDTDESDAESVSTDIEYDIDHDYDSDHNSIKSSDIQTINGESDDIFRLHKIYKELKTIFYVCDSEGLVVENIIEHHYSGVFDDAVFSAEHNYFADLEFDPEEKYDDDNPAHKKIIIDTLSKYKSRYKNYSENIKKLNYNLSEFIAHNGLSVNEYIDIGIPSADFVTIKSALKNVSKFLNTIFIDYDNLSEYISGSIKCLKE